MSERYIAAIVIVFLLAMGISVVYGDYSKKECQVAMAKAGKLTEDIMKICK